jgi:hypothetical protein
MTSKPGVVGIPGIKVRLWEFTLSQGAVCVLPWWCPVYRWRELVVGAGMEQENLSPRMEARPIAGWASQGRPASGDHRERQSTDARHRGGPARSSDEVSVIGAERRGRAGQVTLRSTLRGRS